MENNGTTDLTTTESPADKLKKVLAKAQKPGTFFGLKPTEIQTVFEGIKLQIQNALPRHLTPERMIQVATSCVAKNPAIQECTVASIMGAVVSASILGLNFALGEGYLVPRKANIGTRENPKWVKNCSMDIGYRGYVKLARQSGEIKTIYAHAVRKGDVFEYELGLEEKLVHKPLADNENEITHAYAVAHYISGGYNTVVLSRNQIEKLRKRSPSQGETASGAWATDYEAMCCAKAIKQLERWIPKSDTLSIAAKADDAVVKLEAIKAGEINVEEFEYSDAEFTDMPNEDTDTTQDTENKKAKK